MSFKKGHKTIKEYKKQWLTEYQLIRRYYDKYNHLLAIGYTKEKALKLLRKDSSMSSLNKLKHRVDTALGRIGVTGVSLDNIRITDDVRAYINYLEIKGIIIPYVAGNNSLKLVKPKRWIS